MCSPSPAAIFYCSHLLLFAQASKAAACATLHMRHVGEFHQRHCVSNALRVQVRYVHGHVSLDKFAAAVEALNSVSCNIKLNLE